MFQEVWPLVLLGTIQMLFAFTYGGYALRQIRKEERSA